MSTYHKNQANRFAKLLAQREAELREALRVNEDWPERIGEPDLREVSSFKDMARRSTQAALDDKRAEHFAFELEQVLAATYRLHDGTYGRCQRCLEAIDLRRLTAMPATPYCTACQSLQEHERPFFTRG